MEKSWRSAAAAAQSCTLKRPPTPNTTHMKFPGKFSCTNTARTPFCCLLLLIFYHQRPSSKGGESSHMTAALNKRTIIPLTGIVFWKNASSGNRNTCSGQLEIPHRRGFTTELTYTCRIKLHQGLKIEK